MISLVKVAATDAEVAAVTAVLRAGQWAFGPKVTSFEEQFATFAQLKHAIAVSNGTVALQVALEVLGIGKGDLVITTPFTFIATSNVIVLAGATPVFVDIDADTFVSTPEQVAAAIEKYPQAKAILLPHIFGQMCDAPAILKLAEQNNMFFIEDCAQAQGALWNGKPAGSVGHIGTFSFYATKNLPVGEGGMLTTNNDELATKIRRKINHGRREGYDHIEVGYNYRLSSIAAVLGIEQLSNLNTNNKRRNEIAARYQNEIQNPLLLQPKIAKEAYHVFHQYTLKTKHRYAFQAYLSAHQIASSIIYPLLSYQQEAYKTIPYYNLGCPNGEEAVQEVLSIPVHPYLTDVEVQVVIDCCNQFEG